MIFLFLMVFASAAPVEPLPVVNASWFTPGRSWTWDYFRTSGELYSTETYTVVQRNGDEVWLEMSTQFPGGDRYSGHHLLQVPVNRCLAAYRNRFVVQPWSFRMFYRDSSGQWTRTEPPTTLAFEEKFNCNPHIHDSNEFLTIFRDDGHEFMHKRWRTVEGSWFGPDAVLVEKNFSHGAGSESFVMRRRFSPLLDLFAGFRRPR